MSFIVALFTDTSTELMSGAKSRKWVHHNSTNQPTNQPVPVPGHGHVCCQARQQLKTVFPSKRSVFVYFVQEFLDFTDCEMAKDAMTQHLFEDLLSRINQVGKN